MEEEIENLKKKRLRVTISSSIPIELWQEAQSNHWKWQDLIIRGIQHRKEMPKVLERMRELEENNEKISKKLFFYVEKYRELEQNIQKAGENNG
jgi:hypothetical protein